ncbi:MAG: shikimate kinase [Propioniciclava sp.]|uniref:shikimate kinase n=1 Tax=Propioniciclava sp. TaxID=2038686 RepID=UPI0039E3A603
MTTVALIGAPASGKSTVGNLLARRLGVEFIDVDAVIERREGRQIREIFVTDGEPAFRALEHDVTLELLSSPGVISLGGGAPMTPGIAEALADMDTVWLQVDLASAVNRVGLDSSRPLLHGEVEATLAQLIEKRTPVYRAAARHTVNTSGREPSEVVAEILGMLAWVR